MAEIYERLNGQYTIYTMDHRGTGRSTRLECLAAQALTSGSPEGSQITLGELPSCLQDLVNVYGMIYFGGDISIWHLNVDKDIFCDRK